VKISGDKKYESP
jgi:hypothetical protein